MLKSLFRSVLFAGLLLGLVGNSVAVPIACDAMALDQAVAMAAMPDCSDMAAAPASGSKTDKGMKPACMVMAGCVAVIAMKEPFTGSALPQFGPAPAFATVAAIFTGRDIAPEPEPPALLG